MSLRLALPCLVVLAIACVTGDKAAKKDDKKDGQPEKIALSNVSPFDIAACSPRALDLSVVTQEAIVGALLSAQPAFMECLVDSNTRGATNETRVMVKVNVSDAEVKYDASGDNLLPAGKACIEATAAKLPLKPVEKGAAAISAQFGFLHIASSSPAVQMGINTASDVVGTIRLAQRSWCDCYADVGQAPPPSLKARLKLLAPATASKDAKATAANAPAAEVKLEGSTTEGLGAKVSACLEAKLKALPLPAVQAELQVPYSFLLVNSFATGESVDALPQFQFLQLESIRNQKNADVAIALGGRSHATVTYDAVVQKYKAKPNASLIKELKEKCAAVLASDDKWVASLKGLLDTDQHLLSIVSGLKAKDAQWGAVETEGQKRIDTVTADIKAAEQRKTDDTNACPRASK